MSGLRDALKRARDLAQLDGPEAGHVTSPESACLPAKEQDCPAADRGEPGPHELRRSRPPSAEDMLDMSYEEFVKADLVLHIRSSLLGEDIAIASDERAAKRAWDGVVVYLMEEFCHLYAGGVLNEAALRVLHRLKKQLPESRMTGTHGMRSNKGDTE